MPNPELALGRSDQQHPKRFQLSFRSVRERLQLAADLLYGKLPRNKLGASKLTRSNESDYEFCPDIWGAKMKPRALFGAKCRAVGPSVLIASFLVMAATLGSTAQATAIGGPPIKLISWHTFNVGGWNWGSNEVDLVGIIKNTGSVTADNVVIHVAYKTPDGYFINKWDVPTLLSRVDSEKESTFCSTYIPSAPSGDTLTITSISDQVSKWPANTNFAVAPHAKSLRLPLGHRTPSTVLTEP